VKPSPDQPSLFTDLPPRPAAAPTVPSPAPVVPADGMARDAEPQPSAATDEPDDLAVPGETLTTGLADWKDALRQDFEAWLASLDEIPEADEASDELADDQPDLYSFYEQLAAANAESRKANRRTAEAFSQWSETLARFESSLAPLRETTAQLAAAQPKEEGMSRAHCLMLVELLDRMHRQARAFQSPPPAKKTWWGGRSDTAWRRAWESQRQALDILVSHVEGLLKNQGVTRIDTAGQPFDPAVMMAVAAEPDATRPPQTVLEELAAGYRLHGEVLRVAQVKVTRNTP